MMTYIGFFSKVFRERKFERLLKKDTVPIGLTLSGDLKICSGKNASVYINLNGKEKLNEIFTLPCSDPG